MTVNQIKQMSAEEGRKLYEHPANQLIAGVHLEHIEALKRSIGQIEKVVLKVAAQLPLYSKLLTLPGVGKFWG